jgi:hypothetical protein
MPHFRFMFILHLLTLLYFQPFALAANSEKVSARKEFDFVVDKIEKNYAGFKDKVTDKNRTEYVKFTQKKRLEIQNARNPTITIIEWLDFFRDKHIFYEEPTKELKQADSSTYPTAAVPNEVSFKDQLKAKGDAANPWEGIWIETDKHYTIAIQPNVNDPDEYLGVVISSDVEGWQKGQIKFKISRKDSSSIYFHLDHSQSKKNAIFLADNTLLRLGESYFQKTYPAPSKPLDIETIVPQDRTYMKKLSEKTLYLRIPEFPIEVREELRKLFEEYAQDLKRSENLIIDVRSNRGGSSFAYTELMKYIYTRPIYRIGMETLASADNIEMFKNVVKTPGLTREESEYFKSVVRRLKASAGKYVWWDRQFDIVTFPEILPNPQRVGIIINDAGSTGEGFVLDSRYSHKVTLFGQPTHGSLDYSNLNPLPTPRGNTIYIPTTRSFWLPDISIDANGIPPDISIPESEFDPVSRVQKWLEKQVNLSEF